MEFCAPQSVAVGIPRLSYRKEILPGSDVPAFWHVNSSRSVQSALASASRYRSMLLAKSSALVGGV